MTTAWYGKTTSKQLQQLLQTKPKLVQLFTIPDFVQELKSYNPKLLDYVTNNPGLIGEAIQLITMAPGIGDSGDRKYKYPLQAIEMVETETTCVLNAFFKEVGGNPTTQYFDNLFNILHQPQILPLLSGYFFRTNICLLNNRYKQTLDRIYLKPHLLTQLLNHAHLMPICNTLQLYLNLDINKSPSQSTDTTRVQTKKEVLKKIIAKIETERKLKRPESGVVIENLMAVVIETIEKYYLIADGKQLVEVLTSQQCVETMLALIRDSWEGAYPAFNFFISLINYYSFSSFNADQTDPQKKAKNLLRLQSQPMVIGLRYYFPTALQKITKAPLITLYQYKLLEVLCHCISISSQEVLKTIKETRFFSSLIGLLFKHEENNILHMLIEKSFLHVFISERKIYELYKKHLFCQIDIIELTASRVLAQYEEGKLFDGLKKKTCFGHFMRILKIYSGIQTTQEVIINAIKAKTQVWNKISTHLIKPYESISFKQLGTYTDIPEGKYQQFQVKKSNQPEVIPQQSDKKPLTSSMIEEIRKEDELIPSIKKDLDMPSKTNVLPQTINHEISQQKRKEEELLKAPTHNLSIEFKSASSSMQPPREIKKVESFKEFMSKKKVEAEKEIRLKRSLSHEKRLSGSKGKMVAGLSPKKNSWTEKSGEENVSGESSNNLTNRSENGMSSSTKMSSSAVIQNNNNNRSSNDMPRIPHYVQNPSLSSSNNPNTTSSAKDLSSPPTQFHPVSPSSSSPYRSYYGSSITQQPKTQPSFSSSRQEKQQSSSSNNNSNNNILRSSLEAKSDKNLQILKKIKVIRIDAPKEKKYRRLEEKDKVLLDFLGITSGGK